MTWKVFRRVWRLLERCGLGPQVNPDEADTLWRNQPLLAELYSASISFRVAIGSRAGRRVMKGGDAIDLENHALASGPRCASVAGYSIHPDVCIPAHDRTDSLLRLRKSWRPTLSSILGGCPHSVPQPLILNICQLRGVILNCGRILSPKQTAKRVYEAGLAGLAVFRILTIVSKYGTIVP